MKSIRYPGRQQGEAFQETLYWEAATETTTPARLEELAKVGGSLAIEVARNPNAPKSLLEELSRSKEPLVRGALLQNPNASPELLSAILSTSSKWMLRAAVTCIHDEKLLDRLSSKVRSAPVMSVNIHKSLAQNIDTPLTILNLIYRRWRCYIKAVRRELIEAAKLDPPLLQAYSKKLAENKEPWLETELATAAMDTKAPPDFLSVLATLGSPNVPYYLVRNSSTPATLLESLAQNPVYSSLVAANPSTPISMMEALSRQETLKASIATNPNAPEALLARLVNEANKDSYVLLYAAQNKNTSPETLVIITNKVSSEYIIRAVLLNENLPAAGLVKLSKRKLSLGLRSMIAQHRNINLDVIEELQPDANIAAALASNPKTPLEILLRFAREPKFRGTAVIASLLQNATLPAEVFVEVANQRRIPMEERLAIARNPNTPTEALDLLAVELGPRLRALIASHPNTSKEALQFLAKSKVDAIRDAALARLRVF